MLGGHGGAAGVGGGGIQTRTQIIDQNAVEERLNACQLLLK